MASIVYTDDDLVDALDDNNVKEVEKIMKSGDIIEFCKYNSPLTYYLKFVCCNDEEGLPIVKILVRYESINYRDQHGETALTYAAQEYFVNIFQFLLECGYDPHCKGYGDLNAIEHILKCYIRWHPKLKRRVPMLNVALSYMKIEEMSHWYKYAWHNRAGNQVLDILKNGHKKAILSDIWLLSCEEYDSHFQWHPREIMEDVLALF